MEDTAIPKIIPLHGRSDLPGVASLKRCMASSGTSPHFPLAVSLNTMNDLKQTFDHVHEKIGWRVLSR